MYVVRHYRILQHFYSRFNVRESGDAIPYCKAQGGVCYRRASVSAVRNSAISHYATEVGHLSALAESYHIDAS